MSRLAPVVFATLLITASPAPAQVIYQTGFEAPPFADADLAGQEGWLSTDVPTTPGLAEVQSAVAESGLRSVRLDASLTSFTDYFWRPLNFSVNPASEPIIQITWDMYLDDTASQKSAGWGIEVFDDSLPVARRVTAVIVNSAGSLQVWNGLQFISTGQTVSRNAWHAFRIDMNYAAGARDFRLFLDGALVASGIPFSAMTTETIADVDFYHIDGGGGDLAYYDDFSVAALADGDGDGVPNASDACPATQSGDAVDAVGCSTLDSDGDGVLNDFDACPATLACANPIDVAGCPFDTDGDQIVDGCDNCLAVANGPNEDNQADDDADGIGNLCDACPARKPGDVDGNGVVDARDVRRFNALALGAPGSGDELCAADANEDSAVNPDDVPGFAAALVGP